MTAPSIEGYVNLRVNWDGTRIVSAQVGSRRPDAAAVLRERPLEEAAVLIPRLFSVCGRAQAMLAMALADTIRDEDVGESVLEHRMERLRMEVLREHLWRLWINWPVLADLPAERDHLRVIMGGHARQGEDRVLTVEQADQVSRLLLGVPAQDWLSCKDLNDMAAWAARGETSTARMLHRLWSVLDGLGCSDRPLLGRPSQPEFQTLVASLQEDPDFCRVPRLDGLARETGPLARERRHPAVAALLRMGGATALARLVARLVEAARLLAGFAGVLEPWRVTLRTCRTDTGAAACLDMARGVLLHWVGMDKERIGRYVVAAPTEWNFHPNGACHQGLLRTRARDKGALMLSVARQVTALDPCVRYTLEVQGA